MMSRLNWWEYGPGGSETKGNPFDKQVKILCVDDEQNVLRALRRLFMDEEYDILTATSAEEGLEILEREENIQLVISDYRMPGMNGVDFLRRVCISWPLTMRIVLSGYADTAAVVEAINDGQVYKFIPKPWNDDELRITIHQAIENYYLKKNNQLLMGELKSSNDKLLKINETLETVVKRALKSAFQMQDSSILQHVLSFLPAGIVGIDQQGHIIYCNAAAKEFIGKAVDPVLGSSWNDILPEAFHPFVEKLLAQGMLSETCLIGDKPGWIKGNRVRLGSREGVVLGFDWTVDTNVSPVALSPGEHP